MRSIISRSRAVARSAAIVILATLAVSAAPAVAQSQTIHSYDQGSCGTCHAREGNGWGGLRHDSPDDACIYCHTGSSTYSELIVYDANPRGTTTTNGHTLGSGPDIPASSISHWTEDLTLETTDARGRPVTATVKVRRFAEEPLRLFRLVPITHADGGLRYQRVGPTPLECISCHEPHGRPADTWRPRQFQEYGTPGDAAVGSFAERSYKLLRRYPSGSVVGEPGVDGLYGPDQLVKVPEDSVRADHNFSTSTSSANTYHENGVTRAQPTWVAASFADPSRGEEPDPSRSPAVVNTMALSWWCGDCHNTQIGGRPQEVPPEVGLAMHGDRTHPAPFTGAYDGPGQCYSCHRADLAPEMGLSSTENPAGTPTKPGMLGGEADHCTGCHYGTADYWRERVDTDSGPLTDSDFPHSGDDESVMLLGSYSAQSDPATDRIVYASSVVTRQSLDQVCLRCHSGVGVTH